jgi:hypothetical protein
MLLSGAENFLIFKTYTCTETECIRKTLRNRQLPKLKVKFYAEALSTVYKFLCSITTDTVKERKQRCHTSGLLCSTKKRYYKVIAVRKKRTKDSKNV